MTFRVFWDVTRVAGRVLIDVSKDRSTSIFALLVMIDHEDESDKILCNCGKCSPSHTASHPTRLSNSRQNLKPRKEREAVPVEARLGDWTPSITSVSKGNRNLGTWTQNVVTK